MTWIKDHALIPIGLLLVIVSLLKDPLCHGGPRNRMQCPNLLLRLNIVPWQQCGELTWLRYILIALDVKHPKLALMHCDNLAVLHIVANLVFCERSKHIKMDCHFIRDQLQKGMIVTFHMPIGNQIADIMTIPLGIQQFKTLPSKMGMVNYHSTS